VALGKKKTKPMTPHQVRTRLAAACAGVAIAAVGVAAVFLAFPAQGTTDASKEYGYVYSGTKSSSAEFIRANLTSDSLVVFGSSEFSTPASVVPQVSSEVFGKNNYEVSLMQVGEAYDQSLWHTIALGALAKDEGLPRQKAVLIVSPGWFADGGIDAETFQTRFSYSLWREFCENSSISDETRAYVAERLVELGIDETTVEAASGTGVVDELNNVAFSALDDLSLKKDLTSVRSSGTEKCTSTEATPDWAAMREEAEAFAQTASTNNDWGVEDGFYENQLEPALGSVAGSRASETYQNTPEYEDLAAFLSVANDCGVDVMVVVSPVLGEYYDHIGISAETRAACYERICRVCNEAGATVCDFSDHEYDKYWLYDIVHFGWKGWVDLNEAIYDFAKAGAA
jgi:D-alanine transfer protein